MDFAQKRNSCIRKSHFDFSQNAASDKTQGTFHLFAASSVTGVSDTGATFPQQTFGLP